MGAACTLTFRPASARSGVVFQRMDLDGQPRVRAIVENAVLSERRTQLGSGVEGLHTVEHVLAAVSAAQIDDVLIELNAAEPPIMDGSAAPFFDALVEAGTAPTAGPAEYLELTETVRVIDGDSVYEARPA